METVDAVGAGAAGSASKQPSQRILKNLDLYRGIENWVKLCNVDDEKQRNTLLAQFLYNDEQHTEFVNVLCSLAIEVAGMKHFVENVPAWNRKKHTQTGNRKEFFEGFGPSNDARLKSALNTVFDKFGRGDPKSLTYTTTKTHHSRSHYESIIYALDCYLRFLSTTKTTVFTMEVLPYLLGEDSIIHTVLDTITKHTDNKPCTDVQLHLLAVLILAAKVHNRYRYIEELFDISEPEDQETESDHISGSGGGSGGGTGSGVASRSASSNVPSDATSDAHGSGSGSMRASVASPVGAPATVAARSPARSPARGGERADDDDDDDDDDASTEKQQPMVLETMLHDAKEKPPLNYKYTRNVATMNEKDLQMYFQKKPNRANFVRHLRNQINNIISAVVLGSDDTIPFNTLNHDVDSWDTWRDALRRATQLINPITDPAFTTRIKTLGENRAMFTKSDQKMVNILSDSRTRCIVYPKGDRKVFDTGVVVALGRFMNMFKDLLTEDEVAMFNSFMVTLSTRVAHQETPLTDTQFKLLAHMAKSEQAYNAYHNAMSRMLDVLEMQAGVTDMTDMPMGDPFVKDREEGKRGQSRSPMQSDEDSSDQAKRRRRSKKGKGKGKRGQSMSPMQSDDSSGQAKPSDQAKRHKGKERVRKPQEPVAFAAFSEAPPYTWAAAWGGTSSGPYPKTRDTVAISKLPAGPMHTVGGNPNNPTTAAPTSLDFGNLERVNEHSDDDRGSFSSESSKSASSGRGGRIDSSSGKGAARGAVGRGATGGTGRGSFASESSKSASSGRGGRIDSSSGKGAARGAVGHVATGGTSRFYGTSERPPAGHSESFCSVVHSMPMYD
jgi:hypothetical protein